MHLGMISLTMADESIRQGIKEFSQWPTIPQLFVCSEFVGGVSGTTREIIPKCIFFLTTTFFPFTSCCYWSLLTEWHNDW